jgi:DNA-binding PadR family transcriptional regulator
MATPVNYMELQPGTAGKTVRRITQDIILLGILAGGSKHGYEIRKEIEEKLGPVVGISPSSIYYSLNSLRQRGLLTSRSAQAGKRPKKFVYRITSRGTEILKKMLIQNVLVLRRPYLNLDLTMYFAKYLDHEACVKALERRLKSLKATAAYDFESIARNYDTEEEECILKVAEHNRRLLKEEIRFTKELLADLRRKLSGK